MLQFFFLSTIKENLKTILSLMAVQKQPLCTVGHQWGKLGELCKRLLCILSHDCR